jgi:hypothetical protein
MSGRSSEQLVWSTDGRKSEVYVRMDLLLVPSIGRVQEGR